LSHCFCSIEDNQAVLITGKTQRLFKIAKSAWWPLPGGNVSAQEPSAISCVIAPVRFLGGSSEAFLRSA